MKYLLWTVVIGLLLSISGFKAFACPCEPVWGYITNMQKDAYSLGADKQILTKEEQEARDKKEAEEKKTEKDLRLAPK
jgi:hypothetical protein